MKRRGQTSRNLRSTLTLLLPQQQILQPAHPLLLLDRLPIPFSVFQVALVTKMLTKSLRLPSLQIRVISAIVMET
jgi:hypothetical protein